MLSVPKLLLLASVSASILVGGISARATGFLSESLPGGLESFAAGAGATLIPKSKISCDELEQSRGRFFLKKAAYSGYCETRHPDGALARRVPILLGSIHGREIFLYPSGKVQAQKEYRFGKREGQHSFFFPDGRVQVTSEFEGGLSHGTRAGYFSDGAQAELLHFQEGKPEGTQQSWAPDGRLTMNYTVRDGRRYGVIGRKDCDGVAP